MKYPHTLSEARRIIDLMRSKLLSKPSPDEVQILGMSMEKVCEIADAAQKKGKSALQEITRAYMEECEAKEGKPAQAAAPRQLPPPATRPATAAAPAAARPAPPAKPASKAKESGWQAHPGSRIRSRSLKSIR
jgi:hypothetical protein